MDGRRASTKNQNMEQIETGACRDLVGFTGSPEQKLR